MNYAGMKKAELVNELAERDALIEDLLRDAETAAQPTPVTPSTPAELRVRMEQMLEELKPCLHLAPAQVRLVQEALAAGLRGRWSDEPDRNREREGRVAELMAMR